MPESSAYKAMLAALTDFVPATVLTIDGGGNVAHVTAGRRAGTAWRYARGRSFSRLLRMVFGAAADELLDAYEQACSGQSASLPCFSHETARGLTEFLRWSFEPGTTPGDTVVCVQIITEAIGLEQEFALVSQQNEAANRDLLSAMSKLDFRLMDLDQAHKKLAALYRITSVVQRTVNEAEVLEEIVAGVSSELGYSCAAVLLLDEERQELVMKASRGYPANIRIPRGRGIVWQAVEQRRMIYVPDVTKNPRYIPATGYGVSEVALPLIYADKVIGVLDVETTEERPLHPYDRDLLGSLAGQVALTIAHAKHVAKVEVQAITDGLTGLYNYRYFLTLLDREFKRASRYKRPLSLLMIDVDSFKRYNDTQGHSLGNDVLRGVAEIMRLVCRDVDFVVRYGGEEFIVMLPETNLTEACAVGERVRAAVAEYPFAGRETQPGGALTVSVGVAAYPCDAHTDSELLEHADAALYLAKRTTKNCVMTYPAPKERLAGTPGLGG